MKWLYFILAIYVTVPICNGEELSAIEMLPSCTYVAVGDAKPETADLKKNKSGNQDLPMWPDLGKAGLKINFNSPEKLPRLAILRYGWGDWAIPAIIGVKVNGGVEKVVTLSAGRVQPNDKRTILPVDYLELGDLPVNSLELRVLKIETTANRHGTLKLAVPHSLPVSVLLPSEVGKSKGIGLKFTASKPVSGLMVNVSAYRFRSMISWECALPDLVAGTNEIKLNWDDFISAKSPEVKLTPWNIYQLDVVVPPGAGVELADWTLLYDGKPKSNQPWDTVPDLSFAADADGWRDGIPSDGFGRFGFLPSNGLLVGNITGDGYNYEVMNEMKGTLSLNLQINCGIMPKTAWQRYGVDWSGVTMMQLKRGGSGTEPLSKAFGVYDQSRLPETWIYSVLAPGFLINSSDKVITLASAEDDGRVWALCPLASGAAWFPVDKELPLDRLSEGWLVLVWEKKPELPLLLALQKKPAKLVADKTGVGLVFAEEMGYVGVGTPAGYRGWNGMPGKADPATTALAAGSRNLAAILRAYPRSCTMRFKEEGRDIHFRETFGYVCWENQWQEKGRRLVPAVPLLTFAAAQGYSVKWPNGMPENLGIDTKYGPFCAWNGTVAAAEYVLPVPPNDVTLYLKPEGDVTADKVAMAMSAYFKPLEKKEKLDSLGAWWMFASSSLALPLLNPEQQAQMSVMWKTRQEAVFSDRAWYLRIEPYTGVPYPMSFAWIDKANQILGDPNSGIGAALYGAWAYARTTGDWKMMADNWPKINKMLRFFLVSHDWVQMQTGCREHTAASAIDMDGIAYEGVAGYYHLAKELKHNDEAAMARMLLSRLGVSTVSRWWGMHWRNPQQSRDQWTSIGIGFNENSGFDTMNCRHGGPDHVNGEMALALSWVGQYPELYALHLWGGGKEFWRFFEYEYMEKKVEDWRKKHPGHRNWHDANIAAHLYMRILLGEDRKKIIAEMERQNNGKNASIFSQPDSRMACEDAGFYAIYLGEAFPVRIKDWGTAKLIRASYNKETKTATIELNAFEPGALVLELLSSSVTATLNGRSVAVTSGRVSLPFATGKNLLQLKF